MSDECAGCDADLLSQLAILEEQEKEAKLAELAAMRTPEVKVGVEVSEVSR